MSKTLICPFCHEEFIMGVNGIYVDPTDDTDTMIGCDECLGIERDSEGFFWLPTDEIIFPLDERIFITREQAFRFKE